MGTRNRPLPIGIADFKRAVSEYYYVDKTMLIAELLDYKPLVALFTRPRRFGKSLNIDMLKVFFEDTGEDISVYFAGTRIWEKAKYRKEQGQYTVISLSFKDVKYDSWVETLSNLKFVIQSEYRRHIYLRQSDRLTESDKNFFESVVNGTLQDALLPNALAQLMLFLKLHHGKNVVVLIDEYDTPIQQGHVKGYYEQIIGFMRNFLSGGLKDNQDLERAFLTGILRVAKESIFSGLNNLNVNSILEDRYSSYFGFSETEVKKNLHDYRMQEQFKVVKEWYNGNSYGTVHIPNKEVKTAYEKEIISKLEQLIPKGKRIIINV